MHYSSLTDLGRNKFWGTKINDVWKELNIETPQRKKVKVHLVRLHVGIREGDR